MELLAKCKVREPRIIGRTLIPDGWLVAFKSWITLWIRSLHNFFLLPLYSFNRRRRSTSPTFLITLYPATMSKVSDALLERGMVVY